MARRRSVEDRIVHTAAAHRLEHFCHQKSRIQCDCLAGFQINVKPISLLDIPDQRDQPVHIVILPCDMMPSAQIEPFHPIQVFPELLFHRPHGRSQRVHVLLAQAMKVKS